MTVTRSAFLVAGHDLSGITALLKIEAGIVSQYVVNETGRIQKLG